MIPAALPLLASLRDWELSVLHWINCDGESDLADTLAAFANDPLFGIPVYALLLLLVALSARGRAAWVRLAIALAISLGIVHGVREVLWRVAPRDRPGKLFTEEQILRTPNRRLTCAEHPEMWVERGHPPSAPSFPSSHTISAGAAAAVLGCAVGWVGGVAWLYAALVGLGRLYWGKHWPTDILGSLVLSALAGWVAWRLAGRLEPWVRGRLGPRRPAEPAPPR